MIIVITYSKAGIVEAITSFNNIPGNYEIINI